MWARRGEKGGVINSVTVEEKREDGDFEQRGYRREEWGGKVGPEEREEGGHRWCSHHRNSPMWATRMKEWGGEGGG